MRTRPIGADSELLRRNYDSNKSWLTLAVSAFDCPSHATVLTVNGLQRDSISSRRE